MSQVLALSQSQPIAKGATRLVYSHPSAPDLLIKIIRPDLPRLRKRRVVSALIRELRAYIEVHLKEPGELAFLNPIIGLTKTDLGPGLIVQAANGPDGKPGPTLTSLVRGGLMTPALHTELDRFLASISHSSVVAADLNPHNIVLTHLPGELHAFFVLVDGLGDKVFIPFCRFSPSLNRRQKRNRIARLRRFVANGGIRVLQPLNPALSGWAASKEPINVCLLCG